VFSGWRPHLGQQAFLSSRAPVRVLACGRRWGKTEVIAAEIALTLLAGTARQVLLVAPSQEQAMLGFERTLEFLHRAGARPTVQRTPAPTLALGDARLWARSAVRAEQLVNASPYVRMENYAPLVYANLARACHKLGKHAHARRYLEQALKEAQKVARSSNDLSSENWLIRVACDYASLGDHTRALEIAQTMRPNSQLEVLSFILLEKVRTRNPFWRELVW
jgi:tetratricopeptide (TPR) repeat protein